MLKRALVGELNEKQLGDNHRQSLVNKIKNDIIKCIQSK
jgi:hypothetical protein